MASPTKKVKVRRMLNKSRSGKARKNLAANKGSTSKSLPLNMPNANEIEQKQKAKN